MEHLKEKDECSLGETAAALQRPFASDYEVWARLKELREKAKETEKKADKLHGELWDAVIVHNEDETVIELEELARIGKTLAFLWATFAAEAERGANEI